MFPHGGRGTETTVLLRFNNAKYKEGTGYLKVGPGSPCPVLQYPNMFSNNLNISFSTQIYPPPTFKICSLMEDVARRPPSY